MAQTTWTGSDLASTVLKTNVLGNDQDLDTRVTAITPVLSSYTPTVTMSGSGSVTLSAVVPLRTVKIGTFVNVFGQMTIDSASSPVGDLRFSLKYTASTTQPNAGTGNVITSNVALGTGYTSLGVLVNPALNWFTLEQYAVSSTAMTTYTGSLVSTGEIFYINFSYIASS